MGIDLEHLESLDITERERNAIAAFIDYVDEFGANEYLRGRAKGKLRELFVEVIESFYEATAPMERLDVAVDVETLRLAREIHAMVSECSGHIGRMANPTDTAALVPVSTSEVIPEKSE